MKVLVSGASGGIGRAICALLEQRGDEVVRIDRADFARPEGELIASGGAFDALVFATGFCPVATLRKTTPELFREAFDVNCGFFLRLMREIVAKKLYSPHGMKALAVSSVSAREGWPGGAAYCASKGALSALCRALDAELAPRGISVAALEPRHVDTRMFRECAARMGADPSGAMSPVDFAKSVLVELEKFGNNENV